MDEDEVVSLSIDGVLDLHAFHPRDVKELVGEYLNECRRLRIEHVRIIHGKGAGILARIVRGVLEKHPHVLEFRTADPGGGGWGATTARMQVKD